MESELSGIFQIKRVAKNVMLVFPGDPTFGTKLLDFVVYFVN